jgi:hypothetical protein
MVSRDAFSSSQNNSDTFSLTINFNHLKDSPQEIKEFERKLINLPTFTISDEDANAIFPLPNAASNMSLFHNVEKVEKERPVVSPETKEKQLMLIKCNSNNGVLFSSNKFLNLTSSKALKTSVSSEIVRQNQSTSSSASLKAATTTTTTTTTVTILNKNIDSVPFIVASPQKRHRKHKNSQLLHIQQHHSRNRTLEHLTDETDYFNSMNRRKSENFLTDFKQLFNKRKSLSAGCIGIIGNNNNNMTRQPISSSRSNQFLDPSSHFHSYYLRTVKTGRSHSTNSVLNSKFLDFDDQKRNWLNRMGRRASYMIEKSCENLLPSSSSTEFDYNNNGKLFRNKSIPVKIKLSNSTHEMSLLSNQIDDTSITNSGAKTSLLLQAPNYNKHEKQQQRRVRSNSPSFCLLFKKSKSNQSDHHNQNGNFLRVGQCSGGSLKSRKSINTSTNSAFSGGFLPTPDLTLSHASSLNPILNGVGVGEKSINSFGVVALCTAAISSSIFLTEEQKNRFKEKLLEQQQQQREQADCKLNNNLSKSAFLNSVQNSVNKIRSSASLTTTTPVKITLHNENDVGNSSVNSKRKRIKNLFRKNSAAAGGGSGGTVLNEHKASFISTSNNQRDSRIRTSFVNDLAANSSQSSKPGSEVLALISIWIKNAPNDFMGKQKRESFFYSYDIKK